MEALRPQDDGRTRRRGWAVADATGARPGRGGSVNFRVLRFPYWFVYRAACGAPPLSPSIKTQTGAQSSRKFYLLHRPHNGCTRYSDDVLTNTVLIIQ